MVVDILNKALQRVKHEWSVKAMGLVMSQEGGSMHVPRELAERANPWSFGTKGGPPVRGRAVHQP
jgi:hypothetical protein